MLLILYHDLQLELFKKRESLYIAHSGEHFVTIDQNKCHQSGMPRNQYQGITCPKSMLINFNLLAQVI